MAGFTTPEEVIEPQPKRVTVPSTPANPANAETLERDEPVDDGRTVRGGEQQPVRPESEIEGRDHGSENAFDVDSRR